MAGQYLTTEERRIQRVRAQMMRAAQEQGSSGMMPTVANPTPLQPLQSSANQSPNLPTSPPVSDAQRGAANMDFTGKEAALAQQMRQGFEGFTKEGPQGRMAGNVYAAPTWAAGLNDAAQRIMGGYQMGQAREGREELKQSRLEKAAGIAAVQGEARADEALKDDRTYQSDLAKADLGERTLEQKTNSDLAKAKALVNSSTRTQEGQYGRDKEEFVYINDDGTPDYSKTRMGYNSPEGMRWGGNHDKALVDGDRWQVRDDPNLQAATSADSRGGVAQGTREYRANTFGDALTGLKETMGIGGEGGYDPTTGRAFIDKYANQNDALRWLSTEGGQKYASDASTVKEAALRTSTGAAAPNSENSEYMTTLIPSPFDTQGTVDFKMAKLDQIHTRLVELAGIEGTTQADLNAESNKLLEGAKREESAIKTAATKEEGEIWEDATHRYRKFGGQVQSEKK